MQISELPGPGPKFKVSGSGYSSFEYKLKRATQYGHLSHLRENVPNIVEAIKKHESDIRRGKFNSLDRLNTLREIKEKDETLSSNDVSQIKKILEHLGSTGAYGGRFALRADRPTSAMSVLAKKQKEEEKRPSRMQKAVDPEAAKAAEEIKNRNKFADPLQTPLK